MSRANLPLPMGALGETASTVVAEEAWGAGAARAVARRAVKVVSASMMKYGIFRYFGDCIWQVVEL